MDAAYIPAAAALAGSAIGASASFATTWLTQHQQERARRVAQEMSRRERLYGEFIDEALRLLADALTHHLEEPSKMVPLYAIMGKLRLFAPANVVARADEVMEQIIEIYDLPNVDFRNPAGRPAQQRVDILRAFGEACRRTCSAALVHKSAKPLKSLGVHEPIVLANTLKRLIFYWIYVPMPFQFLAVSKLAMHTIRYRIDALSDEKW